MAPTDAELAAAVSAVQRERNAYRRLVRTIDQATTSNPDGTGTAHLPAPVVAELRDRAAH